MYFFLAILGQASEQPFGYRGIKDILNTTDKEKSKGIAAYVLAEDDAEVLKNANKKLDELLQSFWVCF
jgi:hypothetical protein